MQSRIFVTVLQVEKANTDILEMLNKRLIEKGRGSYIGIHETLGIIAEEYDELKDAARTDDVEEFIRELKDIAVACWFGIASLRQNEIAMAKKHE